MKRYAGQDAGFTLIETVVALSVVALFLVAMPSTIRLGQRAWEARDGIEARAAMPAVLAFVEQRLAEAHAAIVRRADGTLGGSFIGGPSEIEFLAPQPPSAPGGLYRYRLFLRPDGERFALAMIAVPLADDPASGPADDARVLASGVRSFAVSYYGRAGTTTDPQWSRTWDRVDRLPLLVEIRVSVGDGPLAVNHRVVVEPKLGAGS